MQETIAFYLSVLYRDFLAYTTEQLKNLGLSFGQMPLILYAGKHPGCTQAELTRALHLDWGYSQRTVAKLTQGGFLRKEFDPARSSNCLHLTESGLRAFDVCHRVFTSWDQASPLSEEETQTLLALLQKLTAERKES